MESHQLYGPGTGNSSLGVGVEVGGWVRSVHLGRVDFFKPPLGPEVIKLFSCSTQLSLKFQLLINTEIAQIY